MAEQSELLGVLPQLSIEENAKNRNWTIDKLASGPLNKLPPSANLFLRYYSGLRSSEGLDFRDVDTVKTKLDESLLNAADMHQTDRIMDCMSLRYVMILLGC